MLDVTYDNLGTPLTRTLTRADASVDGESWTVDPQGRIQTYNLSTTAGGAPAPVLASLGFHYTASGHRKLTTLPGGISTSLLYDLADRITVASTTTPAGGPYLSTFQWTPEGRPQGTVFGDGTSACRGYDSGDRLTRLDHSLSSLDCAATPLPLASPMRGFGYGYDPVGNRDAIDETFWDGSGGVHNEAMRFVHDVRDRLVVASYADKAEVFGYDFNSNRKTEKAYAPNAAATPADFLTTEATPSSSKRYTYNGRDHLTAIDDMLAAGANLEAYFFDANGRTIRRTDAEGSTYYTWNADDSMRDAVDNAGTRVGLYSYDPSSHRRRKLSNAAAEGHRIYLYDGSALAAELDATTGAPLLVYLSGPELLGVADSAAAPSSSSGSTATACAPSSSARAWAPPAPSAPPGRSASTPGASTARCRPRRWRPPTAPRTWASPGTCTTRRRSSTCRRTPGPTTRGSGGSRRRTPTRASCRSPDSFHRFAYVGGGPLTRWDPTASTPRGLARRWQRSSTGPRGLRCRRCDAAKCAADPGSRRLVRRARGTSPPDADTSRSAGRSMRVYENVDGINQLGAADRPRGETGREVRRALRRSNLTGVKGASVVSREASASPKPPRTPWAQRSGIEASPLLGDEAAAWPRRARGRYRRAPDAAAQRTRGGRGGPAATLTAGRWGAEVQRGFGQGRRVVVPTERSQLEARWMAMRVERIESQRARADEDVIHRPSEGQGGTRTSRAADGLGLHRVRATDDRV